MPLLFYTPEEGHFALQSRSNKQGREERAAPEIYREALERWERLRSDAGDTYGWLLEEDVAREIARIDLPVSMYTQWYWKVDLHNLLHFLTLRVDPRAQYEIRVFAEVIAGVVKRVAPLSYEAWVDYDLGGEPFSLGERRALGALLEAVDGGVRVREGATLDTEALGGFGLSPREAREFLEKLEPGARPDFELDLGEMISAEAMSARMYEAVPGSFE
jgi:thymidylate synthase (FAD)